MNFNILFSLTLALLVVSPNAYAVDPSICNFSRKRRGSCKRNGSLKSCEFKDDYDANTIRCRNENRISFYDNGSLRIVHTLYANHDPREFVRSYPES